MSGNSGGVERKRYTMNKYTFFGVAHFLLTCVIVVGVGTKGALWHWSYKEAILSANEYQHIGHLSHNTWKGGFFARLINSSMGESQCENVTQTANVSSFWSDQGSRPGDNLLEHEMCLFGQLPPVLERESDPRSLHLFSSVSPRFLFAALQFGIFSHAFWAWSPIQTFFYNRSQKESPLPQSRNRRPLDFIVSWGILLFFGLFFFIRRDNNLLVYNNILLVWLFFIYVCLVEFMWAWRSFDSGSDSENTGDLEKKIARFPPTVPEVPSMEFAPTKSMFVGPDIKVGGFMPHTNMPIYPAAMEGTEPGTSNTVFGYVAKLEEYRLMPIPRMMLFGTIFPVFVVVCIMSGVNTSTYNNILYIAMISYTLVAPAVPLYLILLLLKQHTKSASTVRGPAEKIDNQKDDFTPSQAVSGGWMVFTLLFSFFVLSFVVLVVFYLRGVQSTWNNNWLSVGAVLLNVATPVAIVLVTFVCLRLDKVKWFAYTVEIITALVSFLCVMGVYL